MVLKIEHPKSFQEYVKIIEGIRNRVEGPIWYRGCGKEHYRLIPTLFRHPISKSTKDIEPLERKLTTRFRQKSIPFHSRSLSDDWEAIFFMQHYGIPTRLLDWTESPFVAMYFAVMGADFEIGSKGGYSFKNHAAVWILDPMIWNKHAHRSTRYSGEIFTAGDDGLNPYKPMNALSNMNGIPVCMYGAHNSSRIVAQRGVFTIFGQDNKPMEEAFESERFPKDCLIKVKLDKKNLGDMRKAVLSHGVTESVVFPDLVLRHRRKQGLPGIAE